MKLIDQIKSNQAKKISLFFEEGRVGEEVKNNLVSISADGVVVNENERRELIDALLGAIDKIELDLIALYPKKNMRFYLWFDEEARVLRWTVISDLNQIGLPFSSNLEEVTIDRVIANWLAPQSIDNHDELTFSEIENMTAIELRKLMDSLELPNLEVFIRKFS